MRTITCEICGKQELRHDQAFARFCRDCAYKRNLELTRQAYHTNKFGRKAKQYHCKVCGCPIAPRHQYCDECRAERYRTYQREYKRRIRAKE